MPKRTLIEGTRNAPWVVQVLRDERLLFIKRHHRKEDALAEARRQLANRPGSPAVLVYEEIAWAR
jgi:hypothetical protein